MIDIIERCVCIVRSAQDPEQELRLLRATTSLEQFREILKALKTEELKE